MKYHYDLKHDLLIHLWQASLLCPHADFCRIGLQHSAILLAVFFVFCPYVSYTVTCMTCMPLHCNITITQSSDYGNNISACQFSILDFSKNELPLYYAILHA